ncbi:MAG: hypothetical protein CSB44_10210 [Gammaproteobacteria bacterium]|nr:MAG: hypothetical protein CSB44_10210 [Gammaproteobacteria bacterium]
MTLLAYCKTSQGHVVKHVRMARDVQTKIKDIFIGQSKSFKSGRSEEIAFSGDWKPDEGELLTLAVDDQVKVLIEAARSNVTSLQSVDVNNIQSENIRALFVSVRAEENMILLIQRFTAGQYLNKGFSFLCRDRVFNEITEAAFAIGTKLACVVEDGLVKFDSYHNLRSIFDFKNLYYEATNSDIDELAAHGCLHFSSVGAFKKEANQTARRLVHKIMKSEVLDRYDPEEIQQNSSELGFDLKIVGGAIQVPQDKNEAIRFFRFLDDGIYEAALTGRRYVTNSKKMITE